MVHTSRSEMSRRLPIDLIVAEGDILPLSIGPYVQQTSLASVGNRKQCEPLPDKRSKVGNTTYTNNSLSMERAALIPPITGGGNDELIGDHIGGASNSRLGAEAKLGFCSYWGETGSLAGSTVRCQLLARKNPVGSGNPNSAGGSYSTRCGSSAIITGRQRRPASLETYPVVTWSTNQSLVNCHANRLHDRLSTSRQVTVQKPIELASYRRDIS